MTAPSASKPTAPFDIGVVGPVFQASPGVKVVRYADALAAHAHRGVLVVGGSMAPTVVTALADAMRGRAVVLHVSAAPASQREQPLEIAPEHLLPALLAVRVVASERRLPLQVLARCEASGVRSLVNILGIGAQSLLIEPSEPCALGTRVSLHFIVPGTIERIVLEGVVTANPEGQPGTRAVDVSETAEPGLQALRAFLTRRAEAVAP